MLTNLVVSLLASGRLSSSKRSVIVAETSMAPVLCCSTDARNLDSTKDARPVPVPVPHDTDSDPCKINTQHLIGEQINRIEILQMNKRKKSKIE